MRSKTIAKSIVLNAVGQCLLLRRSRTDTQRPSEWDFPGGSVEEGEDITAAAVREINEEAGIMVPLTHMKAVYAATELHQGESVNRILFTVKTDKADVMLSDEHDTYRWVDIDTALRDFPHPFYSTGLRYARDNHLLP